MLVTDTIADSAGDPEPAAPPAPKAPVDPGAAALIRQLRDAIGEGDSMEAPIEIAMRRLRNQSRAGADELDALQSRLLELLAPAGEAQWLRFVASETPRTRFTLGGTAYLIDRDGGQSWELFCALRPIGANWRIWKNTEPIRLDRAIPPDQADQIEFAPSD